MYLLVKKKKKKKKSRKIHGPGGEILLRVKNLGTANGIQIFNFTHEETGTQGREVTSLKSHSEWTVSYGAQIS